MKQNFEDDEYSFADVESDVINLQDLESKIDFIDKEVGEIKESLFTIQVMLGTLGLGLIYLIYLMK